MNELRKSSDSGIIAIMAGKDATVMVHLTAAEGQSLKAFCERKPKRVQKDVLSQVIGWFLAQPGIVKRVVLNDVDDDMASLYAEMLERMAADLRDRDIAEMNADGITPPRPSKGHAATEEKAGAEHGDKPAPIKPAARNPARSKPA